MAIAPVSAPISSLPVRLPTAHRPAGLSDRELADQVLASLLNSSGPILLVVPGTGGGAYEHVIASTVQSFLAHHHGAAAVASLPYPTQAREAAMRVVGIGKQHGTAMFSHIVRQLHALAPDRPVYVASESLGSWVVADALRDAELGAMITRLVMYSTPGFVRMPAALANSSKVVRVEHTDDIVPGLYFKMGMPTLLAFAAVIARGLTGGSFHYPPHRYSPDGELGGRFLAQGIRPDSPVHSSRTHTG